MTIKVERDVVLGWNLAQYGILWYEGGYGQGENFLPSPSLGQYGG
jgi:hypothetical protein